MYSAGRSFEQEKSDAEKRLKEMASKNGLFKDIGVPAGYSGNYAPSAVPAAETERAVSSIQSVETADNGVTYVNAGKKTGSGVPLLGSLGKLFDGVKQDDILLLALFVLLFNENKEDDYLILIVLAILFFN